MLELQGVESTMSFCSYLCLLRKDMLSSSIRSWDGSEWWPRLCRVQVEKPLSHDSHARNV